MDRSSAPAAAVEGPPLPSALLYAMVFVEGFASLGAEIVALRRLVPHLGSAITVTAPTIGFFLLALALGYQAGGRVAGGYVGRVRVNFLAAAALIALGLAGPVVDALFAHLRPAGLAWLLFVGGVLCPVAWLLGQTVPVLTNLLRFERSGERSGAALYWSTLGSFLGSLSLSLGVMQWLGVAAAVMVCAGLLLVVALCLPAPPGRRRRAGAAALAVAAAGGGANLVLPQQIETAYATYRVAPVEMPGLDAPRVFWINNSLASLVDDSEPPRYTRYVERLRALLRDDMNYRGRRILVLGAGGFTLSHREPDNDYTYVDIDPAVRALAEREFLREPMRGRFVAADARRYVADTAERFDAVVVDAYSALTSVPAHLLTREFWQDTRRVLSADGTMVANLIVDPRLASPYARTLLATIQSVYGPCAVEILFRDRPQTNVLVQCFAGPPPEAVEPYTDERNRAELDLLRSR
jgi:predicted membrane-bound spermidine synthase